MKHLKMALMAVLVVAGLSNMNAQDESNTWAIGFGVNAVDFYPANIEGMTTPSGASTVWFDEFFNADGHYNMIPSISRLSVGKYLAKGFSFEAAGTLNKIEKIGDMSVSDLSYFGLDAAVKYDLNNIIGETAWFDPFVSIGGGYTWIDHTGTSNGTGTLNGGAGVNFWFTDNIGLNIQTTYKHSFDSDFVKQHFQHAAGVIIKFGGTDTDGDGVYDKNDACPTVFGLKEFNGCPDSDNDGITDAEDKCPNTAGIAAFNGCPDTDGDGIPDNKDACPKVKGTKANKGCPDTDGDGVVDAKDKCPKVAGPAANNGCPWGDADKDGILDNVDKCPQVAGVASNNGCPEEAKVVSEATKAALQELARTVYFNTSRASFKDETYGRLDMIAGIMNEYPKAKFHIEGHTDSTGPSAGNQRLSDSRANSVRDYLVSKGISAANLTAKGYGEDQPVDSNATRSGRANNRRVEIKLHN